MDPKSLSDKHKLPIKATRFHASYFYCTWCGARFEVPEDRDEHIEWCELLGFTWTPRSKQPRKK